jgi:hypothetical protein
MPRKPIEIPPAAAKAFVKDMRAFHAAATGLERDAIAARQLHALREHQRPREACPKVTDVPKAQRANAIAHDRTPRRLPCPQP